MCIGSDQENNIITKNIQQANQQRKEHTINLLFRYGNTK